MKNKLILFVLLAVFAAALHTVCFAAEPPTVKVSSEGGKIGDTVTLSVTLSNNTGFASLGIEIGYDSSSLKLVGVTPGKGIGEKYVSAKNFDSNPYNMSWLSTVNSAYNGVIATMKFEITGSPKTAVPVTVDYYKGARGTYADGQDVNFFAVGDTDFAPLNLVYVSGFVEIENEDSEEDLKISNLVIDSENKGVSFTISIKDYEAGGTVIAAMYDENGGLAASKTYNAAAGNSIDVSFGKIGKTLKVMRWDFAALKSMSDAREILISQ